MWGLDRVAIIATAPPEPVPCWDVVPADLGAADWWWTPDLSGCDPTPEFAAYVPLLAHLRSLALAVGALVVVVLVALLVVNAYRGRT